MLSYKRYSNCLKCIAASFFMLFFQVARSQDLSALDNLLSQRKTVFGGNWSISVWRDTLLYAKATGEDMNPNTQVPLGCQGTWLTAALAMTFVEQGKISLDDPVAKYLPIYAKYAKSYLTIRHCLANVTGLEAEKGGFEKLFQKTKFESLEAQVNSFAASREIVNNPGQVFNYNNIGTNIVGRVLEVVGRKGFDRLMQERIFRPLGMKRSTFSTETFVNPFSGGLTTASDYIKFLTMLLKKGIAPNGKQILSADAVAEILKIQTGDAKIGFVPDIVRNYHYGLGVWIQPHATGLFVCPGITSGYAYINITKNYAVSILGEPKEKKEEKINSVFSEVMQMMEERM